mmetsp:Transcript_40487/g.86387  ORF Transcript_40487/g.86387 Transcript_40487/m.86387 type:complete len:343 (+) Transcript_40487:111-1139(+)
MSDMPNNKSVPHARRRTSRSPARDSVCAARSCPSTQPLPPRIEILFPGGGMFFWWQLGAAAALEELYDLSCVRASGASAGALIAVLLHCRVDPLRAHNLAFGLAERNDVFRKPIGLCGKWGRLLREWLDELLPADAAEHCSGRVSIAVTHLTPWPRLSHVDHFGSRTELIHTLLASTHIPLFMNGKFATSCNGCLSIDGSFLQVVGLLSNEQLLSCGDTPVLISHQLDEDFAAAIVENGWNMLRPYGTEQFLQYGDSFVRQQAAKGTRGLFSPLAELRRECLVTTTPGPAVIPEPAPASRSRPRPWLATRTIVALVLVLACMLVSGTAGPLLYSGRGLVMDG